jgi:hypothetical protein
MIDDGPASSSCPGRHPSKSSSAGILSGIAGDDGGIDWGFGRDRGLGI